ncbi:MAG: type VI secretion system contractile sheath large subunit [Candidatus Eisenbacteria bacterium]|uniref:Type VI secretion system contractile sheath large subunit n=1 Tax=Eiseniibacteriota bacterium TaxID=2212470 RepID=A0A933SA20_UNCEI|nr:type VI secretion system contractile sheath large subunit [Candidatus Eisenbacteria bacterium]
MADEMEGQQQEAQAPAAAEASFDLLDELAGSMSVKPGEEGHEVANTGLRELMRQLLGRPGVKVNAALLTELVAEMDKKISAQVDEVLHHPEVQKLESAWRSLFFLIDRTNFKENIKIEFVNASKDDLLADFEDEPEITRTGMYKHVYDSGYGVFGGEPVGAIVGNYEFSASPQDVKLLSYCASVAAMAHAPFLTGTSPKMFGVNSYEELATIKDVRSTFEGPQYARWRSFRDSEDARYVGMTCPRYLLRLPYGAETVPVKEFAYEETVSGSHDQYLWGNTAFAMASRLTDAFAKYRWCANIIGPQGGGAVEELPVHVFKSGGADTMKIPTEVQIGDALDLSLSDLGFMSLSWRKGSDNAAFFAANSAQKPQYFGTSAKGKQAEANFKLATRLPYIFVISRLAHYIKVIQREAIGKNMSVDKLTRELTDWINQYVTVMDNPSDETLATKPLKKAEIAVEEVPGEVGWYRVSLKVMPHMKYEGADFTLSLVGKLDKKAS